MSSQSPDKEHKEPQNEACRACRAVKRKCLHGEAKGICTRCARLSIPCEYGQLKRGRKAGEPQVRRKRTTASASAEPTAAPSESTSPSSPDTSLPAMNPPPAHDWLYHDLNAQNAGHNAHTMSFEQPHHFPPIASTSRLDPIPAPLHSHDSFAQSGAANPFPPSIASPPVVTPPAPSPATGGFSLRKLLGTREEPRHSLADAFAVEDAGVRTPDRAEKVFEDIVTAEVCPEEVVDELYEFYYEHLNPMTSILDPQLHTKDWVRAHSPFLFSAIITVATKVAHPLHYVPALRYCKKLLGGAFEEGHNSVEFVQALAILIFWGEATDESGARKMAYAIRSAMDLGMHLRQKRPLPTDEHDARLVLSGERTWMYLTIADHRFSNQRSLPCQIPIQYRYDPISWILEHAHFPCPSEAGLAPLVALSRLLDLYNALINSENGELPNRTLLAHLADASSTWAKHWSVEENSKTTAIRLLPPQSSLVRFYGKIFRFQLDELHLLLAISAPAPETSSSFDPMNSPVLMFGRCVRSALEALACYREEVKVLRYCFDSIFIGAASCGIWLVQNISGMAAADRQLVMDALAQTEHASVEASKGPQSMSAYMARLTAHLLKKAVHLTTETSNNSALAPAFVSASPASAFESQWNGMGNMGGLAGSGVMFNQLQPDMQGTPFFGNMLRPSAHSLGSDLVYPVQDDLLWQSLFPLYAPAS
ncbi:hypothetical protein BCR35DRAFT_308800 [Leucosporidium creatinivorum]|uniref:Zn(2)-C6 fungal-type domain-containing protein n=1 Tax=Leucosporidium creatinivorum TaxID=106004 RepID=A0A1Y2DX13_9BASI|nr:hypothetical protein BCR35DRAFT_308800 [Leucosporidium creatinivorum]